MYIERTDNMKGLFREPPTITGGALSLRPLCQADAAALERLTHEEIVYRYLPTFLFERKYDGAAEVIRRLYDEGLDESLILAVCSEGRFCGLIEAYGYRAPINKVSVGYRLLHEEWGRGIATAALRLMTNELLTARGIEIITASTMVQNRASAHVLIKNGFTLVNRAVDEDWGFEEPTPADKWIL